MKIELAAFHVPNLRKREGVISNPVAGESKREEGRGGGIIINTGRTKGEIGRFKEKE